MEPQRRHDDPAPAGGLWATWNRSRILGLAVLLMAADFAVQLAVYALGGGLVLPVPVGALLGVGAPLVWLARRGHLRPRADLGLVPVEGRALLAAVGLALCALPPASALAELSLRLHPPDPEWLRMSNESLPTTPGQWALAVLGMVVLGPLAEEIVFRALLQRLAATLWGPVPALAVAALAFGLVHGEPWYVFGLVGIGLVLGLVWNATGSLGACWLTHAVHNGLSLTMLAWGGGVRDASVPFTGRDGILVGVGLLGVAVCGRLLFHTARRMPD